MPEFYVIIAGKNIFSYFFWRGGACLLPPSPIRLCPPLDLIPPFVHGWTMAIAALQSVPPPLVRGHTSHVSFLSTPSIRSKSDRKVRSCGTPDSLLLTHGLLLMTGQHGGRYDPQPVTRSSQWVTPSASRCRRLQNYRAPREWFPGPRCGCRLAWLKSEDRANFTINCLYSHKRSIQWFEWPKQYLRLGFFCGRFSWN